MFRGYHFQASNTVQGIGDAGSGSYRTDFLMYRVFPCLMSYILWWAAYIDKLLTLTTPGALIGRMRIRSALCDNGYQLINEM